MEKKFENKDMSNETERFNYALDLFFGMNPAKRYWILLALYFAKNKKLKAIDNYEGNDLIMASMSIDLIGHRNIVEEWNQKGIKSRSIVAIVVISKKDIIDEINHGIDIDAINNLGSGKSLRCGILGVNQMESTYLVEVAEILIGISQSWYERNIDFAFLSILRRAKQKDRSEMGTFYQPVELTNLIIELLSAKDGFVYNPYAGMYFFGTALSPNCQYYAQEPSSDYVIGKLNLLLHNRTNAVCEQKDPLYNWKGDSKVDYIVSVPPFGVRCHNEYRTVEKDYLFRSAFNVRHKAIGIYPSSICFDVKYLSSRASIKTLVEIDCIETVILLAGNTLQNTGIEPVIIIVNKDKLHKNAIRFVDASDCFETTRTLNKLAVDNIMSLCNSDGEHSRLVPISEIVSNSFKIYPKLYIQKEFKVPEGMKVLHLRKVLTPLRLHNSTGNTGRLFTFGQRNSINANGIIRADDLEIRHGHFYRVVNEDCLVIKRDGRFCAKYLLTNGEEVYLHNLYQPYIVNTEVIDPMYLLSELSRDYFLEQLSRYSSKNTGLKMSPTDFLNLKILVPSVREQQVMRSIDSIEKNLETLEIQKEVEYKQKMDSFILNQRQRKHAVAQVLNEILPSMENIETFILANNTVSKNSIVSRRFGTTLETYLSNLRKQLDKVASMVDSFTSQEQYGEAEVIRIEDYLSEYCSSKRAMNINVDYIHHHEKNEIKQKVKISKKDLTQMLDNLITNAVKYGVTDEIEQKYGTMDVKRKDFMIRIETFAIHDEKDPVVIRVSNNGEAVSKSIPLDKLFTWGIGRGTGIGCWQVKEIAEHFGGSVSYKEYPEDLDGFVCEFTIVLPLFEE